MSLKRIILLLYLAVATASQSSPCLLRCKDNNMNEIEKILGATTDWTADLVAPMHSILRGLSERGNSHTVLTNRLRSICKANADFASCVRRCGERTAGVILLKGQTSWTNICNAFRRNVGEFTTAVLPCWARHGAEVGKRCSLHATIVQNAVLDLVDNGIRTIEQHVSDLCKSITMYDKCYVWQTDAFCGEKAWRFVLQLNLNSSVVMMELLRESKLVTQIPSSCREWKSVNEYAAAWHGKRVAAHRRAVASHAPSLHSFFFLLPSIVLKFISLHLLT
uniref:Uncharacterized protein n=1 Tax=Ascaris suum TaxID=6253 RepID=F1LBS4_ASCSU